jgi:hypothetical protein
MLLEADRSSVDVLLQEVLGIERGSGSDEDLNDIMREALNLLQGAFQAAFSHEGLEVILPTIPRAVPSEKIPSWCRSLALKYPLHYVFAAPNMTLRLTLFPFLASPACKPTDLLAVANVLTKSVSLPGSANAVLFVRGTILTESYLEKLQHLNELEESKFECEAVDASPVTAMLFGRGKS